MLDEADLDAAVAAGIIGKDAKAQLLDLARSRRASGAAAVTGAPAPRFDAVHVLYYAGALIVMGSMGLFSTAAFEALGGWALSTIALIYAVGFLLFGRRLWRKPESRVPGGLAVAVAVSLTPLAIYGVQDALHMWSLGESPGPYRSFFPLINGSWVYMELGAIVASALALKNFPFGFILVIAAIALWFMSMDLAALIAYREHVGWSDTFELRRNVSLAFGIAMIVVAWAIDVYAGRFGDFGFWLHLFGAMAFWGGLTAMGPGNALGKAIYCAINVAMIGFAVFLNRRIYAVFGAFGVATYLGYLAYEVFDNALVFSFALSAIGLAIIVAGIMVQRNQRAISGAIDAALPAPLRALRPARALTQ